MGTGDNRDHSVFSQSHAQGKRLIDEAGTLARLIDKTGTVALRKDMRQGWEAAYVTGDGNCFWRAAGTAFFGSDRYWRQLKLVSLAHAAGNVDELRPHVPTGFVDAIIFSKYERVAKVVVDGISVVVDTLLSYDKVFLASIERPCPDRTYSGSVAAILVAGALGVTVKMLNKMDAKSRRKQDRNLRHGGTGGKGSRSDDYRRSRIHKPHGTPQAWYRRVGMGDARMLREDITLVLVTGCCALEDPTQAQLEALPEVQHVSNNVDDICNNFAVVVREDGSTVPFPMHTCAPALYAYNDAHEQSKANIEFIWWEERRTRANAKAAVENRSRQDAVDKCMRAAAAAAAVRTEEARGEQAKREAAAQKITWQASES